MRVKIKGKSNMPELVIGKTYEIIVTTVSWTYRFQFTRKNFVCVTEINQGTVTSKFKMSKKELKQLINNVEFTERVIEINT